MRIKLIYCGNNILTFSGVMFSVSSVRHHYISLVRIFSYILIWSLRIKHLWKQLSIFKRILFGNSNGNSLIL